jgi:hypothetical protein
MRFYKLIIKGNVGSRGGIYYLQRECFLYIV